jgi:hypothetical protein
MVSFFETGFGNRTMEDVFILAVLLAATIAVTVLVCLKGEPPWDMFAVFTKEWFSGTIL